MPTETKTKKPVAISRITNTQKISLVEKAIEMAVNGDFSGVAAMAQVETNMLTRKESSTIKE